MGEPRPPIKRIAVSTGGGDAPGLNAVIRAVVLAGRNRGWDVVGIRDGFNGLMHPERYPHGGVVALLRETAGGIVHLGGTILGTESWNPLREPDGLQRVRAGQVGDSIDAVVAIGGEGTMAITRRLSEHIGLPVVGVPKTIDNDVPATDRTVGFATAVEVAAAAIDRLRTTARSHDRVMVVEVMGRHTGWIAAFAGIAGGADAIVVPERELAVEELVDGVRHRHDLGKTFSLVVVAEGAELVFRGGERRRVVQEEVSKDYGYPRLGGIGAALAAELEERTGYETRATVLGHVLRGGTPAAADRVLATEFGAATAELVHARRFGRMVALRAGEVTSVPLGEIEGVRALDLRYLELARTFFR